MNKVLQRKILWRLVGGASALIAGQIVRTALDRGYKAARGSSPPRNHWRKGTAVSSALMWTTATAVAISITEIFAEQAAGKGWKRVTGKQPPK